MARARTLAVIAFTLAGCGAGEVEPREPAAPRVAREGSGLTRADRTRPAARRVARAVDAVPRAEAPVPLHCSDPSFQGGDLVIGGERVRMMSTCPTATPLGGGMPDRP